MNSEPSLTKLTHKARTLWKHNPDNPEPSWHMKRSDILGKQLPLFFWSDWSSWTLRSYLRRSWRSQRCSSSPRRRTGRASRSGYPPPPRSSSSTCRRSPPGGIHLRRTRRGSERKRTFRKKENLQEGGEPLRPLEIFSELPPQNAGTSLSQWGIGLHIIS